MMNIMNINIIIKNMSMIVNMNIINIMNIMNAMNNINTMSNMKTTAWLALAGVLSALVIEYFGLLLKAHFGIQI